MSAGIGKWAVRSLHLDICRQSKLTGGREALMGEWTLLDCELVPSKTWGFHCVDIRPFESHPGKSDGRLQCHAENTPDEEQRPHITHSYFGQLQVCFVKFDTTA
jgi:hypothetical protein